MKTTTAHTVPAAPAFPLEIETEVASARFPERCAERLCYAQRTSPGGERTFGHFIVEARVLAEAIWQQIDAPLLDETHPADVALHRWLRNPEREDGEPTMLPTSRREFQSTIEQLFIEGRARAFCACCNRNVARREVIVDRAGQLTPRGATRYFCADGHLLLRVDHDRARPFAERTAA